MLKPVRKQSLSDAVFTQLRDQIVNGELAPGEALPAERVLCEALGVNRGSVREGLRRLQQSRLVSIRHGGTSQVLDYRATGGLDLLADLILPSGGSIDTSVVRGIIEMRSALAPDIARRAAERHSTAHLERLDATVARMRAAGGDLTALQELAMSFWSELVDASDNLAYRLAYNSLRATYDQCRALFTRVLADEIGDVAGYAAIATAVRGSNAEGAFRRARTLIERGERGVKQVLDHLADAAEAHA
ncbi:MAG TPA: GntR family transcriptional regulator [Candidatus Dormibacteraeota bacterium]|nr:GntR family transcriptional regulator [Candidatus Dormibacteraeota bacterium]